MSDDKDFRCSIICISMFAFVLIACLTITIMHNNYLNYKLQTNKIEIRTVER